MIVELTINVFSFVWFLVLPVAIDITVNLPDQSDVILKVWFLVLTNVVVPLSPQTNFVICHQFLTELYNKNRALIETHSKKMNKILFLETGTKFLFVFCRICKLEIHNKDHNIALLFNPCLLYCKS